MSELVTTDIADHIATLTLRGKTMPPAFFAEFERAARAVSDDDDVRAVVVQAADKCFTYGLDLRAAFAEHGAIMAGGGTAKPRTALRKLVLELQGAFNALAECPVPVIAAVHGWCIGGGVDLIAACDIRLCTEDATFSVRETKIAIVADLGSLQRLPRIIGEGHARELAFTGKDIDAAHAARIGLVNHVYPDREALAAGAAQMAAEIAANAPLTVRGVKQVLDYNDGHSVAEGLAYVATWNSAFLASEDLGEAVAAFAAKRAPVFRGK